MTDRAPDRCPAVSFYLETPCVREAGHSGPHWGADGPDALPCWYDYRNMAEFWTDPSRTLPGQAAEPEGL